MRGVHTLPSNISEINATARIRNMPLEATGRRETAAFVLSESGSQPRRKGVQAMVRATLNRCACYPARPVRVKTWTPRGWIWTCLHCGCDL